MSIRERRADLHLHTTASDGRLTPTELVRLLAERGVPVAAVTDHDSTEGLDEAEREAARHPGLRLITGIEISADSPLDVGGDVHLLGYFFDRADAALQARLRTFREEREQRGERMVERLAKIGKPVEWERVLAIADGASVGRPHIAQAMVERGYVASVRDAFDGYLNDEGAAYVGRPHIGLEEAVEMVKRAGGAAVLAHPVYAKEYERLLPQLAEMGVVGFEAHYANFDADTRQRLLSLADRLGLLPCGGSDYHAFGAEGEQLPGSAGPPLSVVAELERLAAAERRG